MEIPFKKELWNEHEAVLLIEIQKKIQEGAVSRIQAVSYLSERLRNRMILDGITISDRYRNIAGIDLQLNTVERYISNGSKGFGPVSTSKIFEKVILLQTEDNVAYTNLLEEAELLYPEVKLVKKGKTKFDWDEFEAVLLVNLYKQLLNGILCQEEACRLLKERLGNGSSVVNRTICVSNSDLNEALDDIEHYEKGVIQSINEELKKAIELSKYELKFREKLDTALKKYPLNDLPKTTLYAERTDQSLDKSLKVNEVQDKRDIITANTVGNIDSFLAKAQNSYLVAKLLEQKNKSSKVTIHDFFSICGKIFHIILKDSLRELHSKPDSYSILTGTDGKKYAIWEIDVNHCTEDEIFDLLNESFAFKEGNDKFDYYRFKEKKIKKIELDTKLKHISSDDKFKSLTVKQLTLRARACSEAVLLAKSYGINRLIPIKTFYCSSNGKACHIIPLTSLDAKSSIKKYTIVKNKYGIKFASWMVNALEVTDCDVVKLLNESIIFHRLKSSSSPLINKKIEKKEGNSIQEIFTLENQYVSKQKDCNIQLRSILIDNFKNGYRIGSNMDKKRLSNFYFSAYGEELLLDGSSLEQELRLCGLIYKDKLYVPEIMLSEALHNELFNYIKKKFDDGLQCLYYNILFKTFNERFLDQKIFNETMLRSYLEYYNENNNYNFHAQYLSRETSVNLDISQKVINYVKDQGRCVSLDDVIAILSNFPEEDITNAFYKNKDVLIVSGHGKRFHLDNFQLEDNDRERIIAYITSAINDLKFISFTELINKMRDFAPRVVDNNSQFTETGIRGALSYYLKDLFSFRGSIISHINHPISMQDAFIDFARGRESFTLDEVQEVADGFGTPIINFEALATHNVRVSENKFVNKDYISFDIDAIDDEIGRFCKEDFISITDVNTFTSFPECAYNWNLFLLESYLFSYSKQFKLFHNRFNKTSVSGAIVSINFKSDDYCDIIAKALAKSNIKLEKQNEVLDYLFQNGYIARRKLDNLEKIINKAKLLKMN